MYRNKSSADFGNPQKKKTDAKIAHFWTRVNIVKSLTNSEGGERLLLAKFRLDTAENELSEFDIFMLLAMSTNPDRLRLKLVPT